MGGPGGSHVADTGSRRAVREGPAFAFIYTGTPPATPGVLDSTLDCGCRRGVEFGGPYVCVTCRMAAEWRLAAGG